MVTVNSAVWPGATLAARVPTRDALVQDASAIGDATSLGVGEKEA